MMITLHNTFHHSAVRVRVDGERDSYELTPAQTARVKRELCGIRHCCCGRVRDIVWVATDTITTDGRPSMLIERRY